MEIIEFLNSNKIIFKENVPLEKITGMNLPGTLPVVAYPNSIAQLTILYKFILELQCSYEILGQLTNTYLCSYFKRDIVVITTNVRDLIRKNSIITVGCGYNLTKLARELAHQGIAGYEGLVGIPGTVGAAAINNSGAFTSSMSELVKDVHIIDKTGKEFDFTNKELGYSTRHSILKGNSFGLLVSVSLDISKLASPEELQHRIDHFSSIRKLKIDGSRKSLGSIIRGDTIQRLWDNHRIAFGILYSLSNT